MRKGVRYTAIVIAAASSLLLSACESVGAARNDSSDNSIERSVLESSVTESSAREQAASTLGDDTVPESWIPICTGTEALENLGGDWVYYSEQPVALINAEKNEDGETCFDKASWEVSEDYTLFREIFFGVWQNSASAEEDEIVLEDSTKCLLANNSTYWFVDFYKVSDTVYAFETSGGADELLYWIDTESPDMMYVTAFNGNHLYAYDDGIEALSYSKSSDGTNTAEQGFLSVWSLRELSKEYGIDYATLTEFEFQLEGDLDVRCHDDKYNFYNMWCVEESHEKLVLKTTVGNVMTDAGELTVTCTLTKINGKWSRTISA